MTDETPWYLKEYQKSLKSRGRLLPLAEMQLIKSQQMRNAFRDTQHLHPSELSKKHWCPRASYYTITGEVKKEERLTFSRLNVFEEGHAIHHKWQTLLWKAGVLSGDWDCETCDHTWAATAPNTCPSCGGVRLRYREVPVHNAEYRILGHSDGKVVDKQGTALVEVKSVGVGTVRFEKPKLFADYSSGMLTIDGLWQNIKQPFASHVRQGNLYLFCTGIEEIVFIYEWKPTQEVKEFTVRYNEEIVKPILDGCKRVIECLSENVAPERPDWAESKDCTGCKYCPYQKACWK